MNDKNRVRIVELSDGIELRAVAASMLLDAMLGDDDFFCASANGLLADNGGLALKWVKDHYDHVAASVRAVACLTQDIEEMIGDVWRQEMEGLE